VFPFELVLINFSLECSPSFPAEHSIKSFGFVLLSSEDLFRLACREDLEGIVAKRKDGAYGSRTDWVKIKNPAYSQIVGRHELFEKRYRGTTT
jgi:ATP-dependent DNA ligase